MPSKGQSGSSQPKHSGNNVAQPINTGEPIDGNLLDPVAVENMQTNQRITQNVSPQPQPIKKTNKRVTFSSGTGN